MPKQPPTTHRDILLSLIVRPKRGCCFWCWDAEADRSTGCIRVCPLDARGRDHDEVCPACAGTGKRLKHPELREAQAALRELREAEVEVVRALNAARKGVAA